MNRRAAWCAVACALAAAVVVLIGGIGAVGQFTLETYPVTGRATFTVDDPHSMWLVASQSRARVHDRDLVGVDVVLDDVSLIDPTGTVVHLEALPQRIAYERPDRAGEIIGRFKATRAGTWTVQVDERHGQVLLALGEDRLKAMALWTMISGAVAIALLGGALGCGWVAFQSARRARLHQQRD